MVSVTETTKRATKDAKEGAKAGAIENPIANDRATPDAALAAMLKETRAGLTLQRFEGAVTLPADNEALARAYRPYWSATAPYRLLWEVDPWSGSLFGVVLSRTNTAGLAALLSTPGFQWRECVVEGVREEGEDAEDAECQCRFQIRRVLAAEVSVASVVSGLATAMSAGAQHPADCHPATWYRPATSRWVNVASHQLYVLQNEGEATLSDEQLQEMVTSLVTLLRLAVQSSLENDEKSGDNRSGKIVSSLRALPRVVDLTGCRVSLTDRGATTTMTLRDDRWWTSVGSRAATKDPTPDFGWLPRQMAREWVAAGLWQQGRDGWRATASVALASSLLAASVWLRTKGRYAQWQVDDDTGDVRARWQALLQALTPLTQGDAAKDIPKDTSTDTPKEEAKSESFSLGDLLTSLAKAYPADAAR